MKKIVIIRRGGLGDFVTGTVPLCEHLIDKFGECEFHFFMSPSNVGVAKYFYPSAQTYILPQHNRFYHHARIGLKYRHLGFDIGCIPVPDYPRFDSLFLYCIGAKERYGRIGGSPIARLLLNHPSPLYPKVDEALDHDGLCALKIYDGTIKKIDKKYYPKFRTDLLKHFKPKHCGPYILIEFTNNRPYCMLKNARMADILNKLYETYSFSVIIVGMEKDRTKGEDLQKLLKMDSELCMSRSLDDFFGFINAADVCLVGDGGLCHIAASMDKRVVALFGKTPVYHWGPLGKYVTVLFDNDNVNNLSSKKILEETEKYLLELR